MRILSISPQIGCFLLTLSQLKSSRTVVFGDRFGHGHRVFERILGGALEFDKQRVFFGPFAGRHSIGVCRVHEFVVAKFDTFWTGMGLRMNGIGRAYEFRFLCSRWRTRPGLLFGRLGIGRRRLSSGPPGPALLSLHKGERQNPVILDRMEACLQ